VYVDEIFTVSVQRGLMSFLGEVVSVVIKVC